MGNPAVRRRLRSFDGGETAEVAVARPERLRYWTPADWAGAGPSIPRGAGLSYAAASFGAGALSVSHTRFDRFLGFDPAAGELTVEAGATLWAVQNFLGAHGLHLPCHPGHGRITVGGCVGVDAHGKNHARDGTFVGQVAALELFHPDHGRLRLDRAGAPDLFELTCGGFGLTGHILTVTLRARPLPSDHLVVRRETFADTAEGLAMLARASATADFAYTWHDLSRPGGAAGGHVFSARFGPAPAQGTVRVPPQPGAPPRLDAGERARLPRSLMGAAAVRAINGAFRLRTRRLARGRRQPLIEALFPVHGSELYFRLFGRPGFHECQMLVPEPAAAEALAAVRARAAARGIPVAICSCKRFDGAERLLSFTGTGVAMALDFPRGPGSEALMADLDALVIDCGGRPNIAKDSRLPRRVVEACYPRVEEFRARLAAFDPARRLRSALSERLGL